MNKYRAKQHGATMTEYALLVALIALIAVAGVRSFGKKVADLNCDNAIKISFPNSTLGQEGYYNTSNGKCCYVPDIFSSEQCI